MGTEIETPRIFESVATDNRQDFDHLVNKWLAANYVMVASGVAQSPERCEGEVSQFPLFWAHFVRRDCAESGSVPGYGTSRHRRKEIENE